MICTTNQHVFAWVASSAYPSDLPPGTRCRCGRYTHGAEGVESTALAVAIARATAAEIEVAVLRAALIIEGPHGDPEIGCEHPDDCPRGSICLNCGDGWDEGHPEKHTSSCLLAALPNSRGASIVEAGNRLADAASKQAEVWGALVDGNALRDAAVAWRQALGTSGGGS